MKVRATATVVGTIPLLFATGITQVSAAAWAPVAQWRLNKGTVKEIKSKDKLNPGNANVRLSIQLKTESKPLVPDWDLFRKGYDAISPVLFKMEYQPTGQASCGFKGTTGAARTVRGGPDLSDGRWHTVTCTKTASAVTLAVDGRVVTTKVVRIGAIANDDPVVIGAYRGDGVAGRFLGVLRDAVIEVTGR